MSVDLAEIESLLSAIPDPEIPVITIKELGILRDITYKNETYIVTITPTYTACPAMGWIENEIKEKLISKGITNAEVRTTYTPAWTTDWISEPVKQKLKEYGIAPPQHSSCSKTFDAAATACPRCGSRNTELISRFGSTACKALMKCKDCQEPFEQFKCH